MIVVKLRLVFLLVILSTVALGQKVEKKVYVSKSKDGRKDVFALIRNAEAIYEKDPKKALDYIEEALTISLQEGNKSGEAMCYFILGKVNYSQGLYSQSIDFYNKSIQAYQETKSQGNVKEVRKNLGDAYEGNSNFDKAIEQYNIVLSETEANSGEAVALKYKIGGVYEKQSKTEEALKVYKEVLTIEEKRNNSAGIIAANNRIGNIYLLQEKTKQALIYYEKSQEIAIKEEKSDKLAESFENIGNTLRKEGKFKEELLSRQRSIEINSSLNNKVALAEDYFKIGQVYIEQQESEQAVPFLQKSFKLAEELGNIEKVAEVQQALSEAYRQQRNFVKALDHYKMYVAFKDTLLYKKEKELASMVSVTDAITVKQKQIDLLEKDMQLNEQTIQLLQEEQKFSKVVIYFLSIGLLIVFGSSWMIYNSSRKRRVANQSLALKSLRSQMNPHFIFNALNSVNNYISKNDERAANKYLSDFSKLMRTVMENSQHEFITLTTELNILQLYLSLEHSRFREKFDYQLNVDETIIPDQIELPPMLIQPYIENAVWHGLRYRDDKGFLKVTIALEVNTLKVVVEDNGIGRKRSAELKTTNQRDKISTGLKNTESRLKIINELYRTRMTVKIEDLYPETQSGTKVTIYITQGKTSSHDK